MIFSKSLSRRELEVAVSVNREEEGEVVAGGEGKDDGDDGDDDNGTNDWATLGGE